MDVWDRLDLLHKLSDNLAVRYKDLKRETRKALIKTAIFTGGVPLVATYGLVNLWRRHQVQPQVDEYVSESLSSIAERFPIAEEYRQNSMIDVTDKDSMNEYLTECYSNSFRIEVGNIPHPVQVGDVIPVEQIPYPMWEEFYKEYSSTHFAYVLDGFDAIYNSVYYSIANAAKDVAPLCIGGLALVGLMYALKLRKCKNQIERTNQEVARVEDRLFWNR